jgi:hypothetical protein
MKSLYFLMFVIFLAGCAHRIIKSPQEKYLEAHPEVTGEEAQAIQNKTLTYELSRDAVRASLGTPKKAFGYMSEGNQMEIWVYSEFEWYPYENVLFENGKVKGWNLPKSVKAELEERAAKELLTNKNVYQELAKES